MKQHKVVTSLYVLACTSTPALLLLQRHLKFHKQAAFNLTSYANQMMNGSFRVKMAAV